MKTKSLLFTLFLIYWIFVYGVSFFATTEIRSKYGKIFPTGYRMYAPSTTSTFDLEYEFYKDGQLTEKVLFSDYVENSYKESILKNKKVFLTNNMFFRAQRGLDYEYQKSVYQKKGNWKKDFEDKIKSNYSVRNFMKTCKGFPVLYQETHPDLKFDSMRVLFYRYPTKMPFDPDYKDDFTYYAGEGIYYETVVIP